MDARNTPLEHSTSAFIVDFDELRWINTELGAVRQQGDARQLGSHEDEQQRNREHYHQVPLGCEQCFGPVSPFSTGASNRSFRLQGPRREQRSMDTVSSTHETSHRRRVIVVVASAVRSAVEAARWNGFRACLTANDRQEGSAWAKKGFGAQKSKSS